MDWDQLRNQWQAQPVEASAEVPTKMKKIRKSIGRRDFLETAVAIGLFPVFAWEGSIAARSGEWVQVGFSALLLAVLVYIPLKLRAARRLLPTPDPEMPVKAFLTAERDAMLAQADMLKNVWRWYVGPIAIVCVGFYASRSGFGTDLLVYAAVVLVVSIIIERINRRAAGKIFRAAADDLEAQIRTLEEA